MMTSATAMDLERQTSCEIEDIYTIPGHKFRSKESLKSFIKDKEDALMQKLKDSDRFEPISVKTEMISKRRYKRKLAKELKRRAKLI